MKLILTSKRCELTMVVCAWYARRRWRCLRTDLCLLARIGAINGRGDGDDHDEDHAAEHDGDPDDDYDGDHDEDHDSAL